MQTRKYLKITDAKDGLEVELDSGFTCHEAGKALLHADEGGLWFTCNHGQHFLIDQAQDGYYIGVYPCL
jgi:hypothetical protein